MCRSTCAHESPIANPISKVCIARDLFASQLAGADQQSLNALELISSGTQLSSVTSMQWRLFSQELVPTGDQLHCQFPSKACQQPRAAQVAARAAGSSFGTLFRVTTFGESHGKGVGCIVDGVPPRLPISTAEIQAQLDRRRPGQSRITTPRSETDTCEVYSGKRPGGCGQCCCFELILQGANSATAL